MRACQYYLCDVKPEGVVLIVRLVSCVVQLYSSHSPAMVEPLLPTILRKLLEEEVWLLSLSPTHLFDSIFVYRTTLRLPQRT